MYIGYDTFTFTLTATTFESKFNPYSAGIELCRRQILTSNFDPRTVRVKIFIILKVLK